MDYVKRYDQLIERCRSELLNRFTLLGNSGIVRKEVNSFDCGDIIYLIELISLRAKDDDNYGVVIDVAIKRDGVDVVCRVDVLKSFGPLYSSNAFIISRNGELDDAVVNESLEYISSVSIQAFDLFIQDYLIDPS